MPVASPPLEWPNPGMSVGVKDTQAGISLGELVCSLLARKSQWFLLTSEPMKAHHLMRASRCLQILSTSIADFLQEGDLQSGDLYLKVEIARHDLECSGEFTGSSFPTTFKKKFMVPVPGMSYLQCQEQVLSAR